MFHNLVGHPLMEIAHLCGADRLARWIHGVTLPADLRGAGRLMLEIEAGEYLGHGTAWLSQFEVDASLKLYRARVERGQMKPAMEAPPVKKPK